MASFATERRMSDPNSVSQSRHALKIFASKIEADMRPKKALFTLKALCGAGLAKVPAACAASLAVQSLLGRRRIVSR